jgi:hypothetical protein
MPGPLGINSDSNQYNFLGVSQTAGAAGQSLYWGDKLLCNPSLANCGWVTGAEVEATSYFSLTDEVLHPSNALFHDLAIGGTSTASATFLVEATTGNITSQGSLTLGDIPVQNTDPNRVLTYNTTTGLIEYLDTSSWDKNATDDVSNDDLFWLQTGEQLYPKNASWLDVLVGGTSTASATIALQAETGNIKASSLNLGTNNLSLSGATIGISTDLDLLTLSNNQLSLAGALQLGAYTPGDTSNKLYQASGSLYWAGEKICVEGGPCASTGTVAYDGTPLTGQVAFFSDESTITGSDQYFWNNTQKLLGVGTNDPDSKLHVTGGYGTNALVILNQDNDGNVISASASGVTVMNLTNTGNLELLSSVSNADRLTFVPYGAGDNPFTGSLTSEDLTTDRTWILPNQGGTIALLSDIEGAVGSINYWDLTNEQLHAKNALWHDILIGGTATGSASIVLQADTGNLLLQTGSLGINADADPDNFLGLSPTSGAATGSLYWGNALLCDPTQVNCGWATSAGTAGEIYFTLTGEVVHPKNALFHDLAIGVIRPLRLLSWSRPPPAISGRMAPSPYWKTWVGHITVSWKPATCPMTGFILYPTSPVPLL